MVFIFAISVTANVLAFWQATPYSLVSTDILLVLTHRHTLIPSRSVNFSSVTRRHVPQDSNLKEQFTSCHHFQCSLIKCRTRISLIMQSVRVPYHQRTCYVIGTRYLHTLPVTAAHPPTPHTSFSSHVQLIIAGVVLRLSLIPNTTRSN